MLVHVGVKDVGNWSVLLNGARYRAYEMAKGKYSFGEDNDREGGGMGG